MARDLSKYDQLIDSSPRDDEGNTILDSFRKQYANPNCQPSVMEADGTLRIGVAMRLWRDEIVMGAWAESLVTHIEDSIKSPAWGRRRGGDPGYLLQRCAERVRHDQNKRTPCGH